MDILRERIKPIASTLIGSYTAFFLLHALAPTRFAGVILGVTLTIPIWIVTLAVMSDPSAAAWALGGEAEDWTSTELRRVFGRNAVVIDDVQFDHSNADHVIVGPFGVVVVETKWSATEWASPRGYRTLNGAANQARDGARRIGRTLHEHGIRVTVETLVVAWGGRTSYWPKGSRVRQVAKTTVAAGPFVREWAATRTAVVLSEAQIRAIERAVLDLR
jgi:hypothetical protein